MSARTIASALTEGAVRAWAKGASPARKRHKGAPFRLEYTLDAKGLSVKARAKGKFRYVLPVVATTRDAVELDGRSVRVKRPGGTLAITADREIRLLETPRGNRAFTPIAGLLTAVLYVEGADGEVALSVSTAN